MDSTQQSWRNMFSTIRNVILDRTNRPREEQEDRREEDKQDLIAVDGPKDWNDEDQPRFSQESADLDQYESEHSSDPACSHTSSELSASDGMWRFVQCDSPLQWLTTSNDTGYP